MPGEVHTRNNAEDVNGHLKDLAGGEGPLDGEGGGAPGVAGMSVVSRVEEGETRAPVPASVPGDFVVYLGMDDVQERFDVGTVELLLTWVAWVEMEMRGFPDLLEGLGRLKGAMMTVVAALVLGASLVTVREVPAGGYVRGEDVGHRDVDEAGGELLTALLFNRFFIQWGGGPPMPFGNEGGL